jgi:hypothetical protein
MAYLIQILLPLSDNHGRPFGPSEYQRVRRELRERWGGLTAYTRSPAEGSWADDGEDFTHDDIIVFEVMSEVLDRPWWRTYRTQMEERFRQEVIVVRVQIIEVL